MELKFPFQRKKIELMVRSRLFLPKFKRVFCCYRNQIIHYLILKEIEKVKKQIEASLNIDQSDIQTQASERFNKIFFKKSKLSRNIKGNLVSLKKISRKDIFQMHKLNFTRDNLVIGLAGDIDSDSARKYVDYVFGELPTLGKKKTNS